MSHSGNGWKGAEAINHRNATFSSLTRNCGHSFLYFIWNGARMKLASIPFTVLLLVRTSTKGILD